MVNLPIVRAGLEMRLELKQELTHFLVKGSGAGAMAADGLCWSGSWPPGLGWNWKWKMEETFPLMKKKPGEKKLTEECRCLCKGIQI